MRPDLRSSDPNRTAGLLFWLISIAISWSGLSCSPAWAQASLERHNHYEKWLREDVVYIITEEEREVFSRLSTDEERDAYIEQFWRRRDPDPSTPINEFKEEHYRRIAYANDRFQSGEPGWKTDRGEMYIKFGPPDGLESYPNGGPYQRRMSEGGGRTTAFPFERWRYNRIEGVGTNIEIEFVDPSRTGEYRIALSPQEKDALLNVATMYAGKTEGELMGIENRWLRITRDYGLGIQSRSAHYAIHPDDFPYEKLQRFAQLQKSPVSERARKLRGDVTSRVTFGSLPIRIGTGFFRMGPERYLVPITMEIANRDLSYRLVGRHYQTSVTIYGSITDPSGRIWHEFDHRLANFAPESSTQEERAKISLFQRFVTLPAGRYKIAIAAEEEGSGNTGLVEQSLLLPEVIEEGLSLSPILLADRIHDAADSTSFRQFDLGGVNVVPNVARTFGRNDVLHAYMEVYNVMLDQAALTPGLEIRYFIMREEKTKLSFVDLEGKTIRYVSPKRVVLTTAFRLSGLRPGTHRLLVHVKDKVAGSEARAESMFSLQAGGMSDEP